MELKGIVRENQRLIDGVFSLSLELDKEFDFTPGQFVNVFCQNKILPRPFCIAQGGEKHLKLLIKEVGDGTQYLKGLKVSDTIKIMGPLGTGFKVQGMEDKKVAMVGGGIGIAPLLPLTKCNFKEGEFYLGFNKESYLVEEFSKDYPVVESYDINGQNIVDIFAKELEQEKYDFVYVCGPKPMLKRMQELLIQKGIKGQLSMEGKMACGVGGCLVCTCETIGGNKRICKEGPVFDVGEVVFND